MQNQYRVKELEKTDSNNSADTLKPKVKEDLGYKFDDSSIFYIKEKKQKPSLSFESTNEERLSKIQNKVNENRTEKFYLKLSIAFLISIICVLLFLKFKK